MTEAAERRRERAVRAAVGVARRFGVEARDPRIIRDSNNTLVHLAPAPLVAKVSTSVLAGRGAPALERELSVALHLSRRGAPIVSPASEPPPGPHAYEGSVLTLWEYCADLGEPSDAARAAGEALRRLHDAFADYQGPLPRFTAQIDHAGSLLADPAAVPTLPADDRRFLYDTYVALAEDIRRRSTPLQPLHGEPHEGNVVWAENGPRFVDFEAACRGPLEWDLASMAAEGLAPFPAVDRELLAALRPAKSLCVAAWCWAQPDRAPEVREAAEFHLGALREAAARRPTAPSSLRRG